MDTTTNRIGFIGAGFHASTNLLPAAALAKADIVALVTRDPERSQRVLDSHGFTGRGFGSVDELLRAPLTIDRAIVCAQPADQPGIVRRLLQAGVHVLAEKPLGTTAAEAEALADLAARQGIVLRAAFMKRHAPAVATMTELIAELGGVLSFQITFAADTAAFAPDAESFLRLAAIHHIDLLRVLCGEPERLDIDVAQQDRAQSILATMRMRSGAVGTLRLTNSPAVTSEVDEVEIVCRDGVLRMTDTREIVVRRAAEVSDWQQLGETVTTLSPAVSTMSGSAQDLVLRGFVAEIAAFATADFSGPDDSAAENLRTMRLVDDIVWKTRVALGAVDPLTITFGPAGPIRDAINAAILTGEKTSSSTLLIAYHALRQTVPAVGEVRVVLDSQERPIAELEFDRMHQLRLSDVDEALAALEHISVADWHVGHGQYWASIAHDIAAYLQVDEWEPSPTDTVVTSVFRARPRH